jgi:ribose 5-phosphate isomerase B
MKISIGNDHAGPEYKKAMLKCWNKGIWSYKLWYRYIWFCDYPDFAHPVATDVEEEGKADFGIVICGSGNGIAMTVNKHAGIRAGLCWTKEIAI